ncbi:MAG: peptide deformylase [Bacteroidales bacterium]|nr:peptide deformylase [Bacteroidales bacterium]
MVLPVVAYGHPTLRKVSQDIGKDYPGLKELISDMFETMYTTNGVGLAAPQINRNIRMFIVDATPFSEDNEKANGFRKVFINPRIIEENGEEWKFNEGCLSIPEIREDVMRKKEIRIQYYDEDFRFIDEMYDDVLARIIQHEYDHLQGILFVDKIASIRKILIRKKLDDISKGIVKPGYKMIYPQRKKQGHKIHRT